MSGGSGPGPAGPSALADEFERLRPYLLRVAYSHLGALGEADDVVQEAWLRLARSDRGEIRDLRAWLTTTVARLSIDALTSARARRERYVGTWLPEPLVGGDPSEPLPAGAPTAPDPADRVTLDESVGMAMLVVLESLSPAERSAFLLHDVFGYSFDEVATIVGRTAAATRQLATRARRHVQQARPRYPVSREQQRSVIEAFLAASVRGDMRELMDLLDPDVEMWGDGGGLVPAARLPLLGPDRVSRAVTALAHHYAGTYEAMIVDVNGAPGLWVQAAEGPTVVAFTVDGGRVRAIHVIRNPEKLRPPRR